MHEILVTCAVFITVTGVAMAKGTTYTAAAYEHVIISPDFPEREFTRDEAFEWMSQNLDEFERQIEIASEKGADIIVFPEYGITGFDHSRDSMQPFLEDIPDPEVDWIPCTEHERFPNTLVLRRLSCHARRFAMYVVANMGDIKKCDVTDPSCPRDGRYQFNTNVVFDSKGKLTARYHKYNLYDESPLFDPAPVPEYVTFDTPFGRFGTVVCFDLMHRYPTQVLLSELNVKNLLVTSAWNVFYPFVISTQMYSGISKMNRVNVIASNARNDKYLMASSGIFGSGVSVLSDPEYYSDNGILLISELSSEAYDGEVDHGVTHLDPLFSDETKLPYTNQSLSGEYEYGMNMSFVVLAENSSNAIVCGEKVCCAVEYEIDRVESEEVFIVSASDFVMEELGVVHLQFCAVHRCLTNDLSRCGEGVMSAETRFKYLKLQAFFDRDLTFPIVASTPYNNLTLDTEKDNYEFDQDNAIFESSSLDRPLLVVVILNSLYEGSYTFTPVRTGGSTQQANCPSAPLLLQIVLLSAIMFMYRISRG